MNGNSATSAALTQSGSAKFLVPTPPSHPLSADGPGTAADLPSGQLAPPIEPPPPHALRPRADDSGRPKRGHHDLAGQERLIFERS